MQFVIIGGDAAGMSAASRAKRRCPEMAVTVLEKTRDVSYSACGMPYNIADPERPIETLVVRPAEVFREKQGIDLRTGHCVTRIEPAARRVSGTTLEGAPFTVAYDRLLIATGAEAVIPDLPGCDLPGVFALKSLEDGRRIKAFLAQKPVRQAVIIGMGYIALEMVETLHHRGIATAMVKPRPDLLPWLDRELAAMVARELTIHGVACHAGHPVKRIEAAGDGLVVVCDGLRLQADMVIVGVGVRPNSRLAADAGLALGAGDAIAVDRRLRTVDPCIYAAGDCAEVFHVVSGRNTWSPLALIANRAGWAVADAVCGTGGEIQGVVGTAVFKIFDLEVARTGLSLREATDAGFDPAAVTIASRTKAHGQPGSSTVRVQMVGDKSSGRLLGTQMVGPLGSAAHRINAPAVALHAGLSVGQFTQADLAYAPPFGPVWDPLLTAANQLLKKLSPP
ncbi:MAG: FAD-dependent oxidoreductase [Desulfobacteraceae bacterium]|nr:FAD-dependent oxidoreductase [Desulfobacteraceae bacterium]